MKVLLAAGDPGGSRAIAPLIPALRKEGVCVRVLSHGFLGKDLPKEDADLLLDSQDFECSAQEGNFQCLIWGSSTHDIFPLALARNFQRAGIPTVHLLDNWSSYRKRLDHDGGSLFVPEAYVVMDEAAFNGARDEGIPVSCLKVCGQPDLASLATLTEKSTIGIREAAISRLGLPSDKPLVAFVNEPFRAVMGEETTAAGHCGFTEEAVLASFAAALHAIRPDSFLCVVAHPKQETAQVEAFWRSLPTRPQGKVLGGVDNADLLSTVHGVAGMASILLYKAWLLGIPCMSMQPGSRMRSFRRFAEMSGMIYVDVAAAVPEAVGRWIDGVSSWNGMLTERAELRRHRNAAYIITKLVKDIILHKTAKEILHEPSRHSCPWRVKADSG